MAVLLIRGGVLFLPPALSDDPDAYRLLAENLVEHHCLGTGEKPTAYRPPLYPLLLWACLTLDPDGRLAIGVLHLMSGLATVWLVWRLGISWGLGRHAPLAALLVAVDPVLLVHSASVMTETVATALTCASLVCLTRAGERPSLGRVASAGGCLGLAILCRPTFLVWAAAVACTLPWIAGSTSRGRTGANGGAPGSATQPKLVSSSKRIKIFAIFVLCVAAVLAPWMVRNQIHFGRPVIGTTHGGYTLLLGNNRSFYEYLGQGSFGTVWDASQFHGDWVKRMNDAAGDDEVSRDRLAYSDGIRTIRDQPRMFLYSCLVHMGRLWSPLAHQTGPDESKARRLARYAVGVWYLVELALAGLGLVLILRGYPKRQRLLGTWFWGLLLVVSFTAVHAMYWSNIRMRAPLVPVVAMAATAAIARLRAGQSNCKPLGHKEL